MKLSLLICFFAFSLVSCVEYTEIVELPFGKIRGAVEYWRGRAAYEYKGIPFATPPVGSRRYLRATEPKSWEGIKDTVSYGKSCPQNEWAKDEDQDEDCLYMNIYVNKETFDNRDKQLKPVLVWIHGGGFISGSGNERDAYRGIPLVIVEDVVLVTFNYRLGVLGFFNPGKLIPSLPTNLGLWDQNLALHWVNQNIHLFGGDPNKVTIFGQSAGSASVAHQILSPQSRGLFRGAIMESAGIFSDYISKEDRTRITEDFIKSFNCTNVDDPLACLKSVPWRNLVKNAPNTLYVPIFGDDFLPMEPEVAFNRRKFNDVNLLVGAERDELNGLICATYKFAYLKASTSATGTYAYMHTQAPLKGLSYLPTCGRAFDKVCHGDDIPFIFGAPLREPQNYDADDIELSIHMMRIWGEFARSGKPTRQGPIDWPLIAEKSSKVLNLIELNNKFLGKIDTTTGTNCLAN
ncbi:acetylcholinesterase-like [Tetranychus urticae]|uniref:Carboxylic ester hydrolase n=1 Tax=Tetranychus urticae TaxID=32264 RepID=T1KNW0_TETUR|nr:acetylcholinesterase-like [Tetranychus urticae]